MSIKLLTVGLIGTALNLPFGILRAHCRKFSLEWFVVVHATIPFVAMFRKAVVMPKYSILVTIAAAVVGQAIGSCLEKSRLKNEKLNINENGHFINSHVPIKISDQSELLNNAKSISVN